MKELSTALRVIALLLFVLAGIGVVGPRFAPVAFGLACWEASEMLSGCAGYP